MVGRAAPGGLTPGAPPPVAPPWAGWLWVLAGLCLTLLVLYRWWGDTTTLGECLTLWPSFLWALVLAPRVLWLWRRGARRPALVAGACLAAFVASTTEMRSLLRRAPASAEVPGLPLRVVTWNVAGGAPFAEVDPLRPDIFLLQEGGRAPAPGDPLSTFQWRATLDPAALSRFPLRVLPTRRVGPWTDPQVLLAELPGNRRLIVVNVRLMLPAIVTAAAAGEWRSLRAAHRERVGQFRELAQLVRDTMNAQGTRSVLVAGDFNCPGDARSLGPLRENLLDAWGLAGRGWGGTMPARLPVSRIDQVWVSTDIRVLSAVVLPRASSDHRALAVDIVVP